MTTLTYSTADSVTYKDWVYVDAAGGDYSSFFITGYKMHGGGLRDFQGNYLVIYSNVLDNASAFVQYIYDFSTDALGHRRSTAEQVYLTSTYISIVPRRVWLRGQGKVLQIKFYSQTGKPFSIIGYAVFETSNANV